MASGSLRIASAMRRTVEFRLTQHGNPTHRAIESAGAAPPVLFKLNLTYKNDAELAEIQEQALNRQVTDPRKRMKALVPDQKATQVALAQASIAGWSGMNKAALRSLRAQLDWKELALADRELPFTAENLELIAVASNLGNVALICMHDYDFWFPDDEDQVGNSESGVATSTASPEKPAASASTPT